ncbi:MAG: EAL domain-containing protein [Rhodopseudomonas sp.]|uniref:bifunctional diguanylate cyclase/phosphodiesterase n=1 Tax=Rhodopseudomonas sp. TaxID=1078 RepID=UPI0017F3A44B|nr:EAL domain-containing protein [Rhodopseudomonas sp.]NVN85439.1 EAL domain-containing protein [Rhodopseudomonas sp.]
MDRFQDRENDSDINPPEGTSRRFVVVSALRQGPIGWLVTCGFLLIVAIAVATVMAIGNFREQALQNAERELSNTALLLARHYDRELGDFLAIQSAVAAMVEQSRFASPDDFSGEMSTLAMHEVLRTKLAGAAGASKISIFNSNGLLINASASWPVADITIAHRAYFQAMKAGSAASSVAIELVQSRLSGGRQASEEWKIAIAKRLSSATGEFLGLVVRAIPIADLEQFLASAALGRDSAISIHHRDGVLLARYPRSEAMIGQNLRTGSALQQGVFNTNNGVRLTSPVDGQDRLVSSHALVDFPIVIVAATTAAEALADWRNQTRFLIVAACVSALVVAIILFLIIRRLTNQHRVSQRQLTLDKQRLSTAINNMSQGLLLFDASERMVICNQRYLDMYGLSADVVKAGCSFREVIAHRKQTGSFKGSVEEYCDRVIDSVSVNGVSIVQTSDDRSIQITSVPVLGGGWVATHEDITERQRSDQRIAYLAHYDGLTDLPNRALFRQQLEQELQRANRGARLALLYIDIDEFKAINDTLGHPIGDELLKAVAVRLRECIRETDFVARLGGDEFAIIQTAVTSRSDSIELVERLFRAIRLPYQCLGHHLSTDASIGIAMFPDDGVDLDEIVKNADLAMYSAKAEGRRTYRFFEQQMDADVKARRELESDLRKAIADRGFEIHYQPIVDLLNDEIVGCEALLRWRHPTRGMISPAEFIPIAEETGLIDQLGGWVLATACAEAAKWPGEISLAVNVSPIQFKGQALPLTVAAALAASGLTANRLELEVTEAVLIRDDETALTTLHRIRALGARVSLDDFGTGYSSLSYLQRFPFDKIKIDRSFVDRIDVCEGSAAIVRAVVDIAAARHMTTTAEGVETVQQRELLRKLGCTQMQGYLFSSAISAAAFGRLLHSRLPAAEVA